MTGLIDSIFSQGDTRAVVPMVRMPQAEAVKLAELGVRLAEVAKKLAELAERIGDQEVSQISCGKRSACLTWPSKTLLPFNQLCDQCHFHLLRMSDPFDPQIGQPGFEPLSSASSIELNISGIAAAASRTAEEVRHLDPERESRDRSWIGRRIVWIFTGVIGFALLVFLIQGLRSDEWAPVATEVSDLIRSVVLPVVTLILGYYFGRSGRI